MKKLGLLIGVLLVFLLVPLFSNPVHESTILQVATNWYELQTGLQGVTPNNWAAYPNPTSPSFWRVNFNPGFVYVSADDNYIPILSFCTMGDYDVDDVNQVNEAAESLLADHVLQIEAVKNNQRNTDTLPIWDAILNRTISITEEHDIGLATGQGIQWGGGAPYNAFCPRDTHHPNFDGAGNYEHSRVGCVATAVAQILNYYKQWNYSFSESDRYLSQKDGFNCEIDTDAIQYDFPDFDSLNLLLSDVIGSFNNDATLTDTDKAALSFACGILVKMRYSSNGSGAGSSNIAYDKLNIYCESVSRADTVMFPNDEAWINMVNSQLRLNRPIEYRGYPYGGIGHAYIITGFQTTSMNTTLNLVNWGRPWCHPEYWSLQPTNSACPYPFHHECLSE